MRRFKRNNKGQFVILAAIIIAAFLFSLVYTINRMSLSRQELSYEPMDEVILTITSDFERCLTRALAVATQKYNETRSKNLSKFSGEEVIKDWLNSLLASYGDLGLEIAIGANATDKSRSLDWTLDWGVGYGFSQVFSYFNADIEAYGLDGLTIYLGKYVLLNITDVIIDLGEKKVTIEFQVWQRGRVGVEGEPIQNLTNESLLIVADGKRIKDFALSYLGGGRYTISFKPPTMPISMATITVKTPEDDIIVSAHCAGIDVWSTLYLATNGTGQKRVLVLSPRPSNEEDGFQTPPRSKGQNETVIIKSPPTPCTYTLANKVNLTLYMEASKNAGNFAMNVTVTLGYRNSTGYYLIGGSSTLVEKVKGREKFVFEFSLRVPNEIKMVSEGSIFELKIEALILGGDGTLKIFFGGETPSRIELFSPQQ